MHNSTPTSDERPGFFLRLYLGSRAEMLAGYPVEDLFEQVMQTEPGSSQRRHVEAWVGRLMEFWIEGLTRVLECFPEPDTTTLARIRHETGAIRDALLSACRLLTTLPSVVADSTGRDGMTRDRLDMTTTAA